MTQSPAQSSAITIDPGSDCLTTTLAELPAAHGVYAFQSGDRTLHLTSSRNVQRRLTRLLQPNRPSGKYLLEHLAGQRATVMCWPTGSALESAIRMYLVARQVFPDDYVRRLRLRLPSFLTLSSDEFPRLVITNRPATNATVALGPFASRELAARHEEAVSSLFQIRRCSERLEPSPEHPGCIYGEMSLCLRPCQVQVSAEEYQAESGRMAAFLAADLQQTLKQITAARDRAAEQLDFEYAAELHRQRDKLTAAAETRPEIAAELNALHGVAVTTAPLPGHYWLRPMLAGRWHQPLLFPLVGETAASTSLDARLRHAVSALELMPAEEGDRGEHLALFTRWYHSSSRAGEWFGLPKAGDYPIRRLAHGLSRLARAESNQPFQA